MRSILLATAICLQLAAHAQLTNGCFTIGYTGTQGEHARALVQTNDGGYAFTGSAFLVVKTDANGTVEWNASYVNTIEPNGSGATDLIQTSDNGYAVVGTNTSVTMGFVKLDAAGSVEWSKTYDTGPDGEDDIIAVLQTPDGGYLLTGGGDGEVIVIKTDAAGEIDWSKHYDNNFSQGYAYDVVFALDGGYALCEETGGAPGFHLLRLDANGDVLWAKSYGTGQGDDASALAATPDSGFVVAGTTQAYGFSQPGVQYDAFVVKVDKDGGIEWARAFGDTLTERFEAVVPTSDGGYAMAGSASIPPENIGAPKIYVVKCDANGERLWSQRMGPTTPSKAWDIIECTDGRLAITGVVNASGNVEFSFMKMEADGTICPACGSAPYGSDSAAVILPVDITYDVYDNVATSADYGITVNPGGTAVVGCWETGIAEGTGTDNVLSIAPNPASDRCVVSLGNVNGIEDLEVLGPLGAVIMRVRVEHRPHVELPVVDLAGGVYLIRAIGAAERRSARLMITD